MSELRALTGGQLAPATGAAPPSATQASTAAFQQQLLMAGMSDPAAAATGSFNGVPVLQAQDLYGAMQAGGLPAQAALLGAGAPTAPMANVTGKTDGLDPQLLASLDAVGRELGQKVDIISGNRTHAEQAALYEKYLNGTGNLAARPGTSNHEHGDAADVYVNGVALADVPGAREIAARHGLHFPVGGESWHVERIDGH